MEKYINPEMEILVIDRNSDIITGSNQDGSQIEISLN